MADQPFDRQRAIAMLRRGKSVVPQLLPAPPSKPKPRVWIVLDELAQIPPEAWAQLASKPAAP